MRFFSGGTVALTAGALVATAHLAGAPQQTQPRGAAPLFQLTVDSIMRGPKLVGYPQTGLRWSGDSARLYFEWRRPGDEEAATYVVSKDGAGGDVAPRKLTDAERKTAPPVGGQWDKAHRRVLFVDQGDIVLVDSVASGLSRTLPNEPSAICDLPVSRFMIASVRLSCASPT